MTVDQYQVEFERIKLLYANMNGIVAGLVLMTLFSALFLNATLPFSYAWVWALVALASVGPRLVIAHRFRKGIESQTITQQNVLNWENYWVLTGLPMAIVYSALSFFPYGSAVSLVGVATLLAIFSTASLLTTNMSYKAVGATAAIVIVPLIYHLYIQGSTVSIILATFFTAVLIVFGTYIRRMHKTLMENVSLKIENQNISLTDHLTNLWNRRGLNFYVEKLIPRSKRSKEPFTFIMLDIDNFKKFNDTYGHNAGDVELAKVAICIEQETRDGDLVVRYGGEEFIVVLPATNMEQTEEVAERICNNVRENSKVTISGGLAIYKEDMDMRDIIENADHALYAAKNAGRDRFEVYKDASSA